MSNLRNSEIFEKKNATPLRTHVEKYIFLTPRTAEIILNGNKDVSFNLNYSFETPPRVWEVLNREILIKIKNKKKSIYFWDGSGCFRAAISTNKGSYYSLVETKDAPTLEINGIRMHQTKHTTPLEDTYNKLQTISIGKIHLDTCGGLGYTAIYAKEYGAKNIITFEKDPYVVELARINPWSQNYFKLKFKNMNIAEYIMNFNNKTIDSIIHDPPRFTLAPELYSQQFYNECYRILKDNKQMFHYTGKPREKINTKGVLRRGIKRRLEHAGFICDWYEKTLGYICTKKV